jgi:Domain of unknown function (DUF4398)
MNNPRELKSASPSAYTVAHIGWPILAAAVTLVMAACASTPPPTAQLAVSTAAVSSAGNAGGGEAAPAEMRMARDKLARANAAITAKDYDTARSLAQEAEVDAQLASVKARSGPASKAAAEVQDASRALREEMDRKPK